MTTMNQTAADAIARSISHNEIVNIAFDASASKALRTACDDSVDTEDVTEYWGTTEDGYDWRVHMARA
jgi:hypothetical protein